MSNELKDRAKSLLLYAYRNSTMVNDFVSAFVQPFEDIKDTVEEWEVSRSLATASSTHLTNYVQILNVARGNSTDEELKTLFEAKKVILGSNGTWQDFYDLLSIIEPSGSYSPTGSFHWSVEEDLPKTFGQPPQVSIEFNQVPKTSITRLFQSLKSTKAAGINGKAVYPTTEQAVSQSYMFISGTTTTHLSGGLLWADTTF